MRQKKRNTTEKETRHQRRHDSLHSPIKGEMQQILTERRSGKAKQMTNWSVLTFKGKLQFFRFKIVRYKTPAFNGKFEIKPIPILLTANNRF